MQNQKKFIWMAAPLFLALFIDGMGLGILFPILTALIADPFHSILPLGTPATLRHLLYGVIIAIYALTWFLGAPILSDISDRTGRKKPLALSLFGASIGYILSVLAVLLRSVSLLILGRMIAGFTAGSQPIAQAAIVDISSPDDKTRNLGYILFAVSLGFVVGPVLGALLADNQIVSWFNYTTPFYFAAILSFLNALFIFIFFSETFKKTEKLKIRVGRAIELFVEAFKNKTVRHLSIAFLFLELSWGCFFSFSALFLQAKFNYDTRLIGFYITLMATGFGISFAYIVNLCSKRFTLKTNVIAPAFILGVLIAITALTSHPLYAWLAVAPIGIFMAIAYSATISLYSNQVDESKQGWAMGISNAVGAGSFGIAALFSGFVAEVGVTATLLLASVFALLSAVLMMRFK